MVPTFSSIRESMRNALPRDFSCAFTSIVPKLFTVFVNSNVTMKVTLVKNALTDDLANRGRTPPHFLVPFVRGYKLKIRSLTIGAPTECVSVGM